MQVARIIIYYIAGFLQGLCLVFIPAASTIFKSPEQNAISDIQYGFLAFPMIIVGILSTLFLKQMIGLLGRRKIFGIGCFANAAYMLFGSATYFTKGDGETSFLLFMAGNLMLGLGFGFLVSILNIYTAEVNPKKSDALLAGLHSFLGIGAGFSPQLVSYAYGLGHWQLAGIFGAILCTLILVSIPFVLPLASENMSKNIAVDDTKSSRSDSRLPWGAYAFLFLIFLYAIVETTVGFWTVDYLSIEKKLDLETSLQALSVFWIAITGGRIFSSLFTLKFDGWYLYLVSPIVIFFAIFLLIPAANNIVLSIYILLGLGCSYFFPLSISLSVRTYRPWQEKISGLSVAALMGGIGIGNFFVGYLKNHGYISLSMAFESSTIVSLAILVIAVLLFFKIRAPEAKTD